jgi:transposase InsO family protein
MSEDRGAGRDRFRSFSLSKKIVDPRSPPEGDELGESAPRRRRSFTDDERDALVAELESSDETMEAFAARHGISVAVLTKWRHARGLSRRVPRGLRSSRPYSPDARRRAVETFLESGRRLDDFARAWGVAAGTLWKWVSRYEREGPQGLETRPRAKPGSPPRRKRLADSVRSEIVRTKERFPTFGLRKVRDFLKRFQGIVVSASSVRNTLRSSGIEPVVVPKKRRRKASLPRSFERARPGELWQTDITSLVLRRHGMRVYLVVFLDDRSRYVVSWALATRQTSDFVRGALLEGVARFGKPREVLSDQGRQYFAWRGRSAFERLLQREGIKHVVSRSHHPETLGKCERLWKTVQKEFWDRVEPEDLAEARDRLGHWFSHYNHFRPHQGIDGLVPADRFFSAEAALRTTDGCTARAGRALARAGGDAASLALPLRAGG